jgi:hypothetical protein
MYGVQVWDGKPTGSHTSHLCREEYHFPSLAERVLLPDFLLFSTGVHGLGSCSYPAQIFALFAGDRVLFMSVGGEARSWALFLSCCAGSHNTGIKVVAKK